MRKKSKRILAAALAAMLIWNTCEWQPQALAASLLHQIEDETGADDAAEAAEKDASSKESALKASPSNAEVNNDSDEPDTGVLPGSGTTVPPEINEAEAVKASFGGVEFTGTVKADTAENVLEREQTSIDYQKEVLKNTALYDLEYAETQDAETWLAIPAGSEASLTGILDKQPENVREITLYVRKAAAGEATEIKIPARPKKPDPITNVTKGSYTIKVRGQADPHYEYGISESVDGKLQWQSERTFTSPKPAHTYYVTLRVKATDSSFASKPAERLSVTTPDALLIDGPAGQVSFETKGTYGQTLDQIPVKLATGFQVVNYSRSPVSGTWRFSEDQSGTPAFSIYPEVKGTTAYQVEFIPTETSEGQYGETLTQSVTPEISPKELNAVLKTPIEKDYDGSTDIALEATVEIETPGQSSGQSYNISGLKGRFADANTDRTERMIRISRKNQTATARLPDRIKPPAAV